MLGEHPLQRPALRARAVVHQELAAGLDVVLAGDAMARRLEIPDQQPARPDGDLGEAIVQNVVPKFSATPGSVDFLGPKMGPHNEEIYCGELGLSKERLTELKAAGII